MLLTTINHWIQFLLIKKMNDFLKTVYSKQKNIQDLSFYQPRISLYVIFSGDGK